MDDPKERDEERSKLVEAWHAYGAEFTLFVPQQQPAPTVWDPDVEEFDDKGCVNPYYLKHRKFRTKAAVQPMHLEVSVQPSGE